jgi:hypothetical protein
MLASDTTVFWLNDVDLWMPTLISVGEQQDVVKGSVEGMQMTHVAESAMFVTQDYIPVLIDVLLPTAGNDGSDLIDGGQVVTTGIVPHLEDYADAQVWLKVWRTLLHDAIGLLIQRDERIVCVQHILDITHENMIEIWIACGTGGKGGLLVVDVKLSVRWWPPLSRMQMSHAMMKTAMYPERIWPTTVEDLFIHLDGDGSESKGRVELTDAISELSSARGRAVKQVMQELRRFRKGRQPYLALETTYAKFGRSL